MSRIADRELRDGPRTLPLRIYYPDGAGPFPLLVFSHGLGGSRLGYPYFGRALAAHGIISVHPTHLEALQTKKAMHELQENAEGPARLSALRAMKAAIDDAENWEARPRDLKLVLDSLGQLEELVEPLRGKIEAGRLAVAGHSFGAYSTLLLAGARLFEGSQARSFEDPRPRAFIAMSPPGNGSRGLTRDSWATIERPVLCITGTRDPGFAGQPPEWRREPYQGMNTTDKELVVIDGAEHFTFSGGRPRRPANPAHLRQIEEASVGFLSKHLKR